MTIHINSEEYHPPKNGLLFLQWMIICLFSVFAVRFWYLQVLKGEEFTRRSMDNIQRFDQRPATRGLITDVNGRILAEDVPKYVLTLTRDECPDLNAALVQVSEWTGTPLQEILKRYQQNAGRGKSFNSILLCPNLTFEQVATISGQLVRWPGLAISTRNQRRYPYKNIFSHILGYVAEANVRELRSDRNLALGDSVGKLGLERVFEHDLQGKKGRLGLEVDVIGRVLERRLLFPPTMGTNFRLTIDAELQQRVYDILGDQTGSVVVLDPHTGNIMSLVTTPAYDNNLFVTSISQQDWDQLRNSPYHPMQNRAIQSAYPPGSIWKLVMAGLFMQEGTATDDHVVCDGSVKVGKQTFRCWHRGGHGAVDLKRSIVESCDVYYYVLGERTGINKIEAYARACGFGRRTGIDLPHENSGLVPSRTWKERRRNEAWYRGDTVNVSIGQGSLLTTPIQVAVFIGSMLNGGKLLKPHIIGGKQPEVIGQTPMTAEQRRIILDAMHHATQPRGTAKAIDRSDAEMGGKTGTAQVIKIRMVGDRRQRKEEMDYFERDHAWFASWGRHKGRDAVVVVMLEHGGGGGSSAGPVAKKVYDLLFGLDPREVHAMDLAIQKDVQKLAKDFEDRMDLERVAKRKNPTRSAFRRLEDWASRQLRH